MRAKIVTVVGATGVQGGSIVRALIKNNEYAVRALTRNTKSDAAKALAAKGVEVVQADAEDLDSLKAAFKDSYAVYAVTDFFEPFGKGGPKQAIEVEYRQGVNLAKAASATPTLEHYIWSTLPDGSKISNGQYVVPHFESKNRIDRYIKNDPELLAKTTFLWLTFYSDNYKWPVFTPYYIPTAKKYVQFNTIPADTPILAIADTATNAGIFVEAILAQPQKTLNGKIVLAYAEKVTLGELLETWGRVHGKEVQYVQIAREPYNSLWPGWGEEVGIMMEFWNWARERSWTADQTPITGEDLNVQNLVGLEKALKDLVLE